LRTIFQVVTISIKTSECDGVGEVTAYVLFACAMTFAAPRCGRGVNKFDGENMKEIDYEVRREWLSAYLRQELRSPAIRMGFA
jgi:hypothetical protein